MTYEDYLAHHGVLGMKWGVRRFQNRDGSLTSAGRARYQHTSDFWNEYNANVNTGGTPMGPSVGGGYNGPDKPPSTLGEAQEQLPKKGRSEIDRLLSQFVNNPNVAKMGAESISRYKSQVLSQAMTRISKDAQNDMYLKQAISDKRAEIMRSLKQYMDNKANSALYNIGSSNRSNINKADRMRSEGQASRKRPSMNAQDRIDNLYNTPKIKKAAIYLKYNGRKDFQEYYNIGMDTIMSAGKKTGKKVGESVKKTLHKRKNFIEAVGILLR